MPTPVVVGPQSGLGVVQPAMSFLFPFSGACSLCSIGWDSAGSSTAKPQGRASSPHSQPLLPPPPPPPRAVSTSLIVFPSLGCQTAYEETPFFCFFILGKETSAVCCQRCYDGPVKAMGEALLHPKNKVDAAPPLPSS